MFEREKNDTFIKTYVENNFIYLDIFHKRQLYRYFFLFKIIIYSKHFFLIMLRPDFSSDSRQVRAYVTHGGKEIKD